MAPEDVFLSITDALGGVEDELTQNMTAAAVFGNRFGTQVVGALNQAGGSLRTMMDSFNESGRAMSGEQLEALKKYSDAMTDLDYAFKKMTVDALMPMLPALQDTQEKLATLATDVLPKLMPLIEDAIDIMINSLPVVIQLLGHVADGWASISEVIGSGRVGSGAAEQIMNDLTTAVQNGSMTVEEATAEWEEYTRVTKGWGQIPVWGFSVSLWVVGLAPSGLEGICEQQGQIYGGAGAVDWAAGHPRIDEPLRWAVSLLPRNGAGGAPPGGGGGAAQCRAAEPAVWGAAFVDSDGLSV
jgi:hypothetical protein